MAHSMTKMKGKTGFFAIKVDLSKAYCMLKWSFIENTLGEIGLPNIISQLIMSSVTSGWTNVNWNGNRNDFFQPQKGIRHGDPVSPYLFVLCMDKLSHLICEKVADGRWIGLKAGRNGPAISHLMFADDLLLFGQATVNQMRCVLQVIETFCILSGQQVNLNKTSILFSKNVTNVVKQELVSMSGFKEVNTLGKYLGVPLLGRSPKRTYYHYLIEQVNQKLAGWKARQLSKAGRVTQAKSVIEAMPIYPMMAASIPKGVIHDLQKIRRFVWNDEDGHRKMHAVSWDEITKPKHLGGLGMRRLTTMNTSCLLKLGWELRSNKNNLWCQVMKGKYQRPAIDSQTWIHKSSDSSLWRTLAPLEYIFQNHEYWVIGNGKSVNAWNQKWLSCDSTIVDLNVVIPPDMLNMCVADLVSSNGEWNFESPNDWLSEETIAQIHAIPPPNENSGEDLCAWPNSIDGNYKVAVGYKLLCNFNEANMNANWQQIWRLETKERVRHHMWLICHDRLLTNERK